jgi:hypothetical protein
MQVFQESRRVGRKYYELCREKLGTEDYVTWDFPRYYDHASLRRNQVWITFAVDRFVVNATHEKVCTVRHFDEYNFKLNVLNRIEHLVVEIPGKHCELNLNAVLCRQFRLLTRPNVAKLTIQTDNNHLRRVLALFFYYFDDDFLSKLQRSSWKNTIEEIIKANQKSGGWEKVDIELVFDGDIDGNRL